MEGLQRTEQVLSAFDREVLGSAFRSSEHRHSYAISPVEDIARLLNYSQIPSLAIKASDAVMKDLPTTSFEQAEADPIAQQNLFLQKAAENFAYYRRALLENDPNRPSGMRIKPEVYNFLASVNTHFDNKMLTIGINLLWRRFAHLKIDSIAVAYDENLSRYNLDIENLFDSIRQRSGNAPHSYQEFASELQQSFASDPELLTKIKHLGEELFADDLIWALSLAQGMYESHASSLVGNVQARYNAAALQPAKSFIRAIQPLASQNFMTDPAEILEHEKAVSSKRIEETRIYNERQRQAGSVDYTGEESLLDTLSGKMEPAAFILLDKPRDYTGRQALETLYAKAPSIENEDNRARFLNNLMQIKDWMDSHSAAARNPDFQDRLQTLAETADITALTTAVKTFISEQQVPNLVQTIADLSAAEQIGGQITDGQFAFGKSTSTEPWTSLTNRDIYFEINGQRIIAGSQGEAVIFADRPDITEQEQAVLKLIDQRFIHLEEDLISARIAEQYGFLPKMSPDSIKIYEEGGRVYLSANNTIKGFQYMTPEGPMDITFEAQCQNTYRYNAEKNCLELIGSLMSGHDAERAEGLLYHPTDSKEYQSAINVISANFKKAYQNRLTHTQQGQEAIYHLAQRLGEFEFSNKGAKTLFIENFIKNLRGLYQGFYDQGKTEENVKNHLAKLKDIEAYYHKHQAHFGEYSKAALELIGEFELNIAGSNIATAKTVRKAVADDIIADLNKADRTTARKILAGYQEKLEKDPIFRKVMLEPEKISRYVTADGKSATGSHARILKAAKQQIHAESKKPGAAPLSGAEKAVLAIERKKPWASWKFWGAAALLLAGGALAGGILAIAAPVVLPAIILPAAIGGAAFVAAIALGYFGLRTPKKAAEAAFKAPPAPAARVPETKAVKAASSADPAVTPATPAAIQPTEHHAARVVFGDGKTASHQHESTPPQPGS